VTSHNPIAGAPLFSEVVTGEEGRAMTLDSVPSEARRPADSHHPRPWGTWLPHPDDMLAERYIICQ